MEAPLYLKQKSRPFKGLLISIYVLVFTVIGKFFNPINLFTKSFKKSRSLEIGPGEERIAGFETLNIVGGFNVDYVYDAAKKMPFKDNTFEIIYASHILEHVAWYQVRQVLGEWVRILKPNGVIEIWVPDAYKICSVVLDAEQGINVDLLKDGWFRFNEKKDPYVWANGRLFTYGDGTGNVNHHNWHRAMFTPKSLIALMKESGLTNVELMQENEVRGYSHGWIGLGIRGTKNK